MNAFDLERIMSATTLQENKMGVMPVGKLIANMALPLVISMLVQALYNVVDSIYVSQVSESAVTALSLAFPVQNLLIGFAVGIGVGVNSLLSKSLGERNQEAANRAAGNGIVLMAIATVLFVLFGLFGVRPYFAVQSTNPETVEGGIVYTRICCVFSLGCFASILGERLLQATGRTVHTMITQSTGAIINIILDPILIHGWFGLPAMGIAGAAVATVIGQWVSGIMVILFNLKFNPEVQLHKKYLPLEGKTVAPILTVGIPSIVMNGIGSVMNFGINQILQGFAEGKRSAKDFADDFQKMLNDAVLQGVKMKALEEPLRKWYESFAAASQNGLTAESIASLKAQYDKIIEDAAKQLEQMEQVTGTTIGDVIDRTSTAKDIASMSQDSADELNGNFYALLIYADRTNQGVTNIQGQLVEGLSLLQRIASNTDRLEAIEKDIRQTRSSLQNIENRGLILRKQ